ncbi:MAG: AAA family ATPase, partial [Gemmobacter sp.]
MTIALRLSPDQAEAHDRVTRLLRGVGIDLHEGTLEPPGEGGGGVLALTGKAGSGKTMLLAELVRGLRAAGVDIVSGDYEGRRRRDRRTLAVLAPTNKAASVLRTRGVPATTIHRILYTPIYAPEYEKLAEWLAGNGPRPTIDALSDGAMDRARIFYDQVKSVPGALAAAGLTACATTPPPPPPPPPPPDGDVGAPAPVLRDWRTIITSTDRDRYTRRGAAWDLALQQARRQRGS